MLLLVKYKVLEDVSGDVGSENLLCVASCENCEVRGCLWYCLQGEVISE